MAGRSDAMAKRSRQTFQKHQKAQARRQKQQQKAARRIQAKQRRADAASEGAHLPWGWPTDDPILPLHRRREIGSASRPNRGHARRQGAGAPSEAARRARDTAPGIGARGGTPMRMPRREEHMAPHRDQAARVQVHCPAVDTHTRQLILEQAMIDADGWACWLEDGHVSVGDVQAGPCCNPPEVSAL
jgi:hypothetical protein